MSELTATISKLSSEIRAAIKSIGGQTAEAELAALSEEMNRPDFWHNSEAAQQVAKKQAKLAARYTPWLELRHDIDELSELVGLGDDSLAEELSQKGRELSTRFDGLRDQLKFSGTYDDLDAFVTISAGAGGTDAQDWAAMLERMYLRFAEHQGYSVEVIDRSSGEEAGIKSVSFQVSGTFCYAHFKSEHGVHRLVRLSPFNSDNLRQTSFAKVEVVPVIDTPEEIAIDEKDLKVDVYRSGGKGGQSVNTTDSAVRVTHIPTGIVVAIQNERSQLQNKEKAMQILRSRLALLKEEQHKESLAELKGPNEQASWGNQIRSYVLHPYKMIKDLRTQYETSNVDAFLEGDLLACINTYLSYRLGS